MNRFEKYIMFTRSDGEIVYNQNNKQAFELAPEAFALFQELFDHIYGSIHIDENLVSIHSGGWSENEELIYEFMETSWWFRYHKITANGGHYYFNTDLHADKEWKIEAQTNK